jgi:hypothetical protein
VIGNAAILRTARLFRDIAAVRDAARRVHRYRPGAAGGRPHSRAIAPHSGGRSGARVGQRIAANDSEAALQSDVAGRIAEAVGTRTR